MKLKYRLLLALMFVGLIPAGVIAISSIFFASNALEASSLAKVEALREAKASSVTRYLSTIREQVTALAHDPHVVYASVHLSEGFAEIEAASQSMSGEATKRAQDALVREYYEPHFFSQFSDGASVRDARSVVEKLSPVAIELQTTYISNNSYPVGEKSSLDIGPEKNGYDKAHLEVHPYLREFLERFGFYDIFILDLEGKVIYSVFKEVDFATSLKQGPFSTSGLAQAFNTGIKLAPTQPAAIVDFSPYMPSYNAPAGFLATPIVKDKQKVGVLVAQFPLKTLNDIMAERSGLGESGETYLVGADKYMRSDSIINADYSVLNSFQSNIKANAPAIDLALSGQSVSGAYVNYVGEKVFSASKPLDIFGLEWALVAEVNKSNALAAVSRLQMSVATIILFAFAAVVAVAIWMAAKISRPLGGEPEAMEAIAVAISQGDLTLKFTHSGDETGVYKAMSEMNEGLLRVVGRISHAANQQYEAAADLAGITQQRAETIQRQNASIDQVAVAMGQLSETVNEVGQSTVRAAEASGQARDQVQKSVGEVLASAEDVSNMSSNIFETNLKIEELQRSATEISSILGVIERIAEQTNLLALNAAIEAARAGEQGRGFAVVADEVRGLAQNTQKATSDIASMISSLQTESSAAAQVMRLSADQAKKVAENASSTTENLKEAVAAVELIADMNAQVSAAVEEQSAVAADISHNVDGLNAMANDASQAVGRISQSSDTLAKLASSLQRLVGTFTLK